MTDTREITETDHDGVTTTAVVTDPIPGRDDDSEHAYASIGANVRPIPGHMNDSTAPDGEGSPTTSGVLLDNDWAITRRPMRDLPPGLAALRAVGVAVLDALDQVNDDGPLVVQVVRDNADGVLVQVFDLSRNEEDGVLMQRRVQVPAT
jgi:hypothetical protein